MMQYHSAVLFTGETELIRLAGLYLIETLRRTEAR